MRLVERLRNAWGQLWADSSSGMALPPDSDFWYHTPGYGTATGLRISPETALRVAAVYACVRVVAQTVASLPAIIYRSLPNGGKERAVNHPLYKLLHDCPNQWQTSYEFFEMVQAHLELRGNAFARIVSGPRRAIEQLIPLHPDRVQVYRLPNGRLKYQVRSLFSGEVDNYVQEEMLHFRGMSSDGLVGMSTVALGAETIACGLASQEFAARYFDNSATPSGVYRHPKTLSEPAYQRLKKDLWESQTGENRHRPLILEEGMEFSAISLSNKDSQLLEARQFSRGDIASIFGIPPHKIGDLSRATFSNIEQQNIEFATDCIRPRLVRNEQRINYDLIDPLDLGDGNEYFVEFQMDALLRGDLKSRYEAYGVAIDHGFMNRNEARIKENMNPAPGLDRFLQPLNFVESGEQAPVDPSSDGEDSTGTGARRLAYLKGIVRANAERVIRKEVKALQKLKSRCNGDLAQQVTLFYQNHSQFVSETMRMSRAAANAYVAGHCDLRTGDEVDAVVASLEKRGVELLSAAAFREIN